MKVFTNSWSRFYVVIVLFFSLSLLITKPFSYSFAQEKTKVRSKQKRTGSAYDKLNISKKVSIKEMVYLALRQSDHIRIQQLEIIKSDTQLRKNNSQYAPRLESGWQVEKRKDRYSNSLTRKAEVETRKVYLKAKKLFSSGTYFETEASDNRISSGRTNNPAFASFAQNDTFSPATLHTTNLSVLLRQELLKNSFGYVHRRQNQNFRK